jgi:hypothetical protein
MESAANTMSEASGLAELMDSVEEVFAGSDLKLMANTLARMRRGLKVAYLRRSYYHLRFQWPRGTGFPSYPAR